MKYYNSILQNETGSSNLLWDILATFTFLYKIVFNKFCLITM